MNTEIEYERTDYDRISRPVAERYERISRERGRTVVPLDAFGRDASGKRPNSVRVEVDPVGDDADSRTPDADSDGTVGDRSGLGWRWGRGAGDE